MGNEVSLVSSAEETAKDLYRVLVEGSLLRSADSPAPTHRFLATGDAAAFESLARRFLGPEVGSVQQQKIGN
jgi:glutamate racemase